MKREDDFAMRREHLAGLSDEQLYDYFWQLAEKLTQPLLEAGKIYTTPAIERSVLLRMGFSSLEAQPIVNGLLERQLLGHGAGHAVWRLAEALGLSIREAGLLLVEQKEWARVEEIFRS